LIEVVISSDGFRKENIRRIYRKIAETCCFCERDHEGMPVFYFGYRGKDGYFNGFRLRWIVLP
jgi:hypothetical protein